MSNEKRCHSAPQVAGFTVGTANPREKDAGRKGKETGREGER